MAGILDTTLCNKDCQWLVAGQCLYNWNIVESGVKHHNPNPCLCLRSSNLENDTQFPPPFSMLSSKVRKYGNTTCVWNKHEKVF